MDFSKLRDVFGRRLSVVIGEIAAQIALVLFVLSLGYVVLVRPQLKRLTAHQSFLESLKVGDRIVTRGGLIGSITAFDGSGIVHLALSDSVKVNIERNSIERGFRGDGAVSARD